MNRRLDVPRFLLVVEAEIEAFHDQSLGRWRFDLQSCDGAYRFEATDWEPGISLERLVVLTIIRGLEELEQPAAVTVVTDSDYVHHAFDFGLREWRQNDWKWERFGEWVPIANDDLWRRLNRACEYHQVQCRRGLGLVRANQPSKSEVKPVTLHRVQPRPRSMQRWIRQLSRIASSIVPV